MAQRTNQKKKQYFSIIVITFLALTSFFIGREVYTQFAPAQIEKTFNITPPQWWDDDFQFTRNIAISNQDGHNNLNEDEWVEFEINHKKLIEINKSNQNGEDLRLVYWDQKDYHEIDIEKSDLNTEETKVTFQIYKSIDNGETDPHYFLYYGNNNLFNEQISAASITKKEMSEKFEVKIGSEKKNN